MLGRCTLSVGICEALKENRSVIEVCFKRQQKKHRFAHAHERKSNFQIISNADSVASKLSFSLTVKCNEHSGRIHHGFFVLILGKSKRNNEQGDRKNETMEDQTE